jgi:short-subunit dehydrogenase
MSFDGQRVVIIGASAGIGEATAVAFAARGAAVTITGRSKERLDQAALRIGHPILTGGERNYARDYCARTLSPLF